MFILTQKNKKLIHYNTNMIFSVEKSHTRKSKYNLMCNDEETGYIHRIAINLPLYVAKYLMVRILCSIINKNDTILDIDEELRGV